MKRASLLPSALMLGVALLAGAARGQVDAVTASSSDGTSQTPRLVITTSTATEHAEVRITSAILRLSSTTAGTNAAAGDLRYSGGSLLYHDGSSWQTIQTPTAGDLVDVGPASAQAYTGSNPLIHVNENGGSSPSLMSLKRGGSNKFLIYNDGDLSTARWADDDRSTYVGVGIMQNNGNGNTDGCNTMYGYRAGLRVGWIRRSAICGALAKMDDGGDDSTTQLGYRTAIRRSGGSGVFVGAYAGGEVDEGGYVTCFGYKSMYQSDRGSYTAACGYQSGYNTQMWNCYDIWIGSYSGYSSENAAYNTYIGHEAGYYNVDGDGNICIGHQAGKGTAVHDQATCIFIGYQAGMSEHSSNKLYIDNSSTSWPLVYGDFGSNRVTIYGNVGIGTTNFGTGADGVMAIAVGTTNPSTSPANVVQLYAQDESGSAELRVRDEGGNVTTLSPHNFSLLGGPSEPMAWSYYSRRDSDEINVDMLRTVRAVEAMTGQSIVKERKGGVEIGAGLQARGEVEVLEGLVLEQAKRIRDLRGRIEALEGNR